MSMSLFKKNKIPEEKPGIMESSFDFHVDMVQKIDQILKNHSTFEENISQDDHSVCFSDASFVEQRMPLQKSITLSNPRFQPEIVPSENSWTLENHQMLSPRQPSIPVEFQAEVHNPVSPEFRFITSFPEKKEILKLQDISTPRVEIINLSTFMHHDQTETDRHVLNAKKNQGQNVSSKKQEKKQTRHDTSSDSHVEIVNIHSSQGVGDTIRCCSSEALQTSEDKSKVFYLASKKISDKHLKKLEKEQAYIPVNLEEKALKLKEKEQEELLQKQKEEEEQKKKEQEQQKQEQQQQTKESKKLQKLEEKKKKQEEKKQKKEELKLKKLQEKEAKKQKKGKKEKTTETKDNKKLWKQQTEASLEVLDDDLKQVLMITDELLGKLPEEVIEDFAQSKEFEIYEKVLSKYKIKS